MSKNIQISTGLESSEVYYSSVKLNRRNYTINSKYEKSGQLTIEEVTDIFKQILSQYSSQK